MNKLRVKLNNLKKNLTILALSLSLSLIFQATLTNHSFSQEKEKSCSDIAGLSVYTKRVVRGKGGKLESATFDEDFSEWALEFITTNIGDPVWDKSKVDYIKVFRITGTKEVYLYFFVSNNGCTYNRSLTSIDPSINTLLSKVVEETTGWRLVVDTSGDGA